jgi:hypothetical protein
METAECVAAAEAPGARSRFAMRAIENHDSALVLTDDRGRAVLT